MTDAGGSWRELAAVAVVLLLPIPLLAASGLRIPLPTAIERGLASLTPGGGFDVAVVEAPTARAQPAPSDPSGAEGEETSAEAQAASSTVVSPGGVGAVTARSDERRTPARGDADSPASEAGNDSPPSGGGRGGGPGEDAGESTPVDVPTGAAVSGSVVEATEDFGSAPLTVPVDAAGASAEISVTEDGVGMSTGGAVEAAPDASVSPPPLPVPLP